MVRISLLIFTIASTTLMGIAIIVVLSAGLGTAKPIIYAVIVGLVLAVPVTWIVAKKIAEMR